MKYLYFVWGYFVAIKKQKPGFMYYIRPIPALLYFIFYYIYVSAA